MNVTRAKTAGFCMGVGLALRKLDETADICSQRRIHTLGPIIHNPQVLEEYEAMGVSCINTPAEAEENSCVVIRAHGIPRPVEEELGRSGVEIVDATCPKVKKAQLLIARHAESGRRLLLFGEDDHPEVKGLLSYAGDFAFVFDSLEELKSHEFDPAYGYFLAAQTTQDREGFETVVQWLQDNVDSEIPVLNTICDATRDRQREALAVAKEVEVMVVVGGYTSGNTRRLASVCSAQGIECYHVETPEELPLEKLREFSRIGLTAGASTPKKIIDSIQDALESL